MNPIFRSRIALTAMGLVFGAWLLTAGVRIQAQECDPGEDEVSVAVENVHVVTEVAGAGPTPGNPNPGGDRKSRRMQMIKALSFDRRPSAILKAWHEPPPKDPEPQPSGAATSATEKPGNAPSTKVEAAAPEQKPAEEQPSKKEVPAANTPSSDPATTPKTSAEQAEAAKKAEQAQKEQAAKQAEEAKRKAAEDAAFQRELTRLQRQVTLGEWKSAREYVATLEMDEAKALYGQMLASLQSGAVGRIVLEPNLLQQLLNDGADTFKIQQALSGVGQGPGAAYMEKNLFTMPDMLGLLLATPGEFEADWLQKLGLILQFSINAGFDPDALLAEPPIVETRNGPKIPRDPTPEQPAEKRDEKPSEKSSEKPGEKTNNK